MEVILNAIELVTNSQPSPPSTTAFTNLQKYSTTTTITNNNNNNNNSTMVSNNNEPSFQRFSIRQEKDFTSQNRQINYKFKSLTTSINSIINKEDNDNYTDNEVSGRNSYISNAMSISSLIDSDQHPSSYSSPLQYDNSSNSSLSSSSQTLLSTPSPPPTTLTSIKLSNYRYQSITVSCYHTTVAQKSYGSEKRFLCPPPVVVFNKRLPPLYSNNNNNFNHNAKKLELEMSVICENDINSSEHKMSLDDEMNGTFKYLYVNGTAKSKTFTLELKLFEHGSSIPHLKIDSLPVTIISKPSKKSAKARNISLCILSGSYVSLFNRINSQTVRTKYLEIENGILCATNTSWSPFQITLLNRSYNNDFINYHNNNNNNNNNNKIHNNTDVANNNTNKIIPITYGSEIILSHPETGFKSDRLIVCKVEKGRISQNAIGPVSQMQKVALRYAGPNDGNDTHTNNKITSSVTYNGYPVGLLYLSASGPLKVDTTRSSNACAISSLSPFLRYQSSRIFQMQNGEFLKEPFNRVSPLNNNNIDGDNNNESMSNIIEEIDDHLCWTIVGISKFQSTYHDRIMLPDQTSVLT